VIDETIDGEVVAIDLETGTYYSLRATGALVWAGIDARVAVADIAAGIGIGIDALIADLEAESLIRPATEPPTPWSCEPDPDAPAPELERFTDLEDLLLLDPIHDVDAEGWPRTAGT
jgi:hypothetical protein